MESPFLDIIQPGRISTNKPNNASDDIIFKSPLLDPGELVNEKIKVKPKSVGSHSAEILIEHDVPPVSGTVTKKLINPLLTIRLKKFTWRSKLFSLRDTAVRRYAVNVGCLPKNISIFFSVEGQVMIRSESTGEEIPYSKENHALNFPGSYFFKEVDFIPDRGMNLTFLTRHPATLDREGGFVTLNNNLQLEKYKDAVTFWFVVSDPAHKYSAPKGSGTGLVLETISTDIAELCEEAAKAENAANYYSDWYKKQADKFAPINSRDQLKPISFNPKELGEINYYLHALGIWLDSKGFLKLIPGFRTPDYWTWYGRNGIWNERQTTAGLTSNFIADKLNYYKTNFFVGKEKPLPFYVFIGELRRFEDLNAGDIDIDEQIRRLRRCGHESSLIFDEVLNLPVGDSLQYSNRGIGGRFQFLKSHNRIEVNGTEIDFWHLFVGLDALARDKGPKDKVNLMKLPVAQFTQMERAAAATWAGDIGSALIDWLVRFNEAEENKNNLKTLGSRLNYYWKTRASTADLDGDILAWGIYELRKTMNKIRLSDVLLYFFHPAHYLKNRRNAFELFVKHYSLPGKSKELDIVRAEEQINEFGRIWNMKRLFIDGKTRAYTEPELQWASAELVSKFINYVDREIK